MKLRLCLSLLWLILPLCALAEAPHEQEATKPTAKTEAVDYVRYAQGGTQSKLKTAIVTMQQQAVGAQVDLIGAVHIADRSYYTELNQRFTTYEAVLYELVGGPIPKDYKTATNRAHGNLAWVAELQQLMQTTLGLSGQLEGIDYLAPNLVHADLSMEQFNALRQKKSESFLGLLLRSYQVQQEMQAEGSSAGVITLPQVIRLLRGADSQTELKRIFARQFHEMERLMQGMEGEQGTVIIGERNKAALDVLAKQIKLGKKRLAIFYGAAHLPDMQRRLEEQGWKAQPQPVWLDAWVMGAQKE
jgi:hypothetical protein